MDNEIQVRKQCKKKIEGISNPPNPFPLKKKKTKNQPTATHTTLKEEIQTAKCATAWSLLKAKPPCPTKKNPKADKILY